MSFFSVTLTGKDAIRVALEKAGDAIERGLIKNTQAITLAVHAHAITMIQKNTDGVKQLRYNPKRTVTVSKPGDTPNTDTGTLAKSIVFEFEQSGEKFTGFVGTNLKYGAWLEFGTTKMAARPWLLPALQRQQNLYVDKYKKEVQAIVRAMKKAGTK